VICIGQWNVNIWLESYVQMCTSPSSLPIVCQCWTSCWDERDVKTSVSREPQWLQGVEPFCWLLMIWISIRNKGLLLLTIDILVVFVSLHNHLDSKNNKVIICYHLWQYMTFMLWIFTYYSIGLNYFMICKIKFN
jgi:hypothetical protein